MGYAEEKAAADQKRKELEAAAAAMPAWARDATREVVAVTGANDAQSLQTTRLQDTSANTAFDYGGIAGAAAADTARYRQANADVQNRAPTLADYAQANQARGAQGDAMGMYRDAAMGTNMPTGAAAQYQQGLDRSMASNMAMANSARGGSLALAQGRLAAMGQNANALAGSTAQAAQLRAQEEANWRQAGMAGYAGLASQMRGQDQQGSQFNASLGMQNRALNDQTGLAYEHLGQGVQGMQMQGQLSREAALAGNVAQQQQYANQVHQQNQDTSNKAWQTAGGIWSTMAGLATGGMGSAAGGAAAGIGQAATAKPAPFTGYGNGYGSNGVNGAGVRNSW